MAVSDLFAGCYAAVGNLAALTARERTGRGAHVETDLFSATLASLINVAQSALLTGEEAKRHGNAHPQIVPYRSFSAADADFVLAVGTDRQFARLARMVGHPEWASDPRYQTNPQRVANRESLEESLSETFRREPRQRWLDSCREAAIPAGPVRGPLEALRSETAQALRSVLENRGQRFVASAIRLEGHTPRLDPAPSLDADGEKLRREFGLPDASGAANHR